MEETSELYWLLLNKLPGCGPALLRRLIAGFGDRPDPLAVLQAPEGHWRRAGAAAELLALRRSVVKRGKDHPLHRQAREDQLQLQRCQARILVLGYPDYPALLAHIHDPPPMLYASGEIATLRLPQFAVVGSRRHGSAGGRAARELSADLCAAGFSICSGLALGIDGLAHRAALDTGGFTVAVMGTGIDRCYPRRHQALADAIRERGLLLTEFPPGTGPRRDNFPRRNRLISGLSVGVLVVEAARRSGSLITARLAMEQNREVFALPHSIYDPGGGGCHALLRDGATLVECAEDILGEVGHLCQVHLGQQRRETMVSIPPELPATAAAVWGAIGYEPVSIDQLALAGAGDAATLMAGLVELQLRGLVENRGGLYMRK